MHTCDDPLACAINALIAGPDPRVEQLERLHEVLDRVEEIVTTSKSKMAAEILMLLHTARGGPR